MKMNARCLHCKKVWEYSSKNAKGIYCSNQCQSDYAWEKVKKTIRKERQTPPSSRVARRYLLDKFGNKCKLCKTIFWRGKHVPLVLDHINGNSDDWSLTNLRMICPNCDAQTDFYKAKNKGNGRHARRMRYKLGLSY